MTQVSRETVQSWIDHAGWSEDEGLAMLRFERKPSETTTEVRNHSVAEGEWMLFLGILVASWGIAVGVGWVIWKMTPL